MSKIHMNNVILLCVAILFLNILCASQQKACAMYGQADSSDDYTSIKAGNYTLLWEVQGRKARAKEDLNLNFRLKNNHGEDVAEDGSGKIYVKHFLTGNVGETPDGRLWVGRWNSDTQRYEAAANFPEPGNWGLWVEFYKADSLLVTGRLLLQVTGDAGHGGHEEHNNEGMQNHGDGCH